MQSRKGVVLLDVCRALRAAGDDRAFDPGQNDLSLLSSPSLRQERLIRTTVRSDPLAWMFALALGRLGLRRDIAMDCLRASLRFGPSRPPSSIR